MFKRQRRYAIDILIESSTARDGSVSGKTGSSSIVRNEIRPRLRMRYGGRVSRKTNLNDVSQKVVSHGRYVTKALS